MSIRTLSHRLRLALSFASGMAALIYETAWFQSLELVIGSTAVSLALLLAAFMGGNCLGSLLFARAKPIDPLRIYAWLEVGIGGLGILELALMPIAGRLYVDWATGTNGFLLRGLVAAACLLPPALLMGATLPVLAARAKRDQELSWLYGVNIAGAVFGCLLTGFYLLRLHDVATATYVAAAINALAAAIAWRYSTVEGAADAPAFDERFRGSGMEPSNASVYTAVALSGFCALAAETIWTRKLGLLFGASVYTFSIVLAVFLAGLGIGSALVELLHRRIAKPRLLFGWCQMLVPLAIAWASYASTASLPFGSSQALETAGIWRVFATDTARALFALLPATIFWGASFPMAVAAHSAPHGSHRMARVYAANTFGAITGALSSSLLLVSWIGSQHTERLLILVSVASAALLFAQFALAPVKLAIAAASVAFAVYMVPPLSGVLVAHGRFAPSWQGKGEVVYAAEGMNSPVAVTRFGDGSLTFHVAGKIQASSVPRDMRLQRMLGHLTTLVPNQPRSVLVIGCGAGVTAGAVALDPAVEHVTIAEIEPLVPRVAAVWFAGQNYGVLHNPKVRLRVDDGRHFLLTSNERFDAITADPLDPWVKGAANLYTLEMFQSMKDHLRPGGVVTMYIQLFETNKDAVKSALATFFQVFPHGTVWGNPYQGKGHDMVLMGQVEQPSINLDAMEARFAPVADSLAEVEIYSPTDLFGTYAGRAPHLKSWLRGAAINRDGNLRMQYLAGLGLNRDDAGEIYADMLTHRRYPEGLFTATQERMNSIRLALLR